MLTLNQFNAAKDHAAREIIEHCRQAGTLSRLKADGFAITMNGMGTEAMKAYPRTDTSTDHSWDLEIWKWEETLVGYSDWQKDNTPLCQLCLSTRSVETASKALVSEISTALARGSIESVYVGRWHITAMYPTIWHARQAALACKLIFSWSLAHIDNTVYQMPTPLSIVADGATRAWCTRCALECFAGIRVDDCTEENVVAFLQNVRDGKESNQRGGILYEVDQQLVGSFGRCAVCHGRLMK